MLELVERVLEAVAVDPLDHLAEHLDQPPVRVEREPPVARPRREPFRRRVAEAEVEDRVHHPRHRDRGTRAHRDEQRVVGVAEALAGLLLEPPHVLGHLVLEPVRNVALGHVRAAGVGRDREPGRHGQPHQRHLREADPLAAEQLTPAVGRLVEVVDVAPAPLGRDSSDAGDFGSERTEVGRYFRRRARNSASHASERRPNQNGVNRP